MLNVQRTFYLCTCFAILIFCTSCTSSKNNIQKANIEQNKSISNQFQKQFLLAVNKVRSQARKCGRKSFPAAPALSLNSNLNDAAYMHSLDMSKSQFLEHTSSNGDTLEERMQAVNYSWRVVGENIAHNQKNIRQVIDDWLTSPGHCSNLMSSDYSQTGVAVVNRYWTQVYASPK